MTLFMLNLLKKPLSSMLLVSTTLILSACGGGDSSSVSPMTTWSFSGSNGPEFWHLVVDRNGEPYTTCKYGQRQSPINITEASLSPLDLPNVDFQYQPTAVKSTTLGFGIYGFDLQEEPTHNAIVVNGVKSELQQIHLHTPSDHQIDGKPYDGAIHFVHKDTTGAYTFVAVLLQVGASNENIATLIDHLPDSVLLAEIPEFSFDLTTLLPPESQRASYRYSGSFTTPACAENVNWIIMQTPIEFSQKQLAVFQTLFDGNTRPIQQLNDRTIEADTTPSI